MDLIFEQYGERLRRKERSPHTLGNWNTIGGRLSRWLETQGVSAGEVSFALLELYFDTLDLSASSKATHLRYVQAAYNYAIKVGAIKDNPALQVEVPDPPERAKRIIPNAELRKIKAGIYYEHDWLLFHILTYTGMRRNEIKSLLWDDGSLDTSVVKLSEQTIRVIGKGGKLRLVPIHPALGEVLAQQEAPPGAAVVSVRAGKPISEDTMQVMTKRLSEVYTPHDFRRTVTTSLDRNGVRESVIDEIMGWSPRSIRNRFYREVAREELLRAILKLYSDDPV